MLSERLYGISTHMMSGLMKAGSFFNKKLSLGVAGREGLLEHLEAKFGSLAAGRPVAWFHAASLGEFEQGRPVMEALRRDFPHYFIVLTFFSPSGYEVRKNYSGADLICYLPLDTPENARRFVHCIKPGIAFFIKYEFWPNYLKELRVFGAKILSFSAIFREDQVFFKPYGGFYRDLLTDFDHLFVQNPQSVGLLKSIGVDQVTEAGDTRFDRVREIVATAKDLPEIAAFVGAEFCLVAGSVWPADMDVLVPALNSLPKPIKVIFAPHEIHDAEMTSWAGKLNGKSVRYSEYVKQRDTFANYLFIDNIGMLSALYRYGQAAYIGGSFGSGLHNVLEAATYGMPVIFGNKKYMKFQEANDLILNGGAQTVSGVEDLLVLLQKLIGSSNVREQMGDAAGKYVASQTGATARIMQEVSRLLKKSES